MIEATMLAMAALAKPIVICYLVLGTIVGLIFGVMPGLGGVVALTISLPFTFGMNPLHAMFLYSGIMGSITFGGSVSAILLNTPGTAHNAATSIDGYPMTQAGHGAKALGISATASGFGALFGIVVLVVLVPVVRKIVLSFGPPEIFSLVLFGLVTVAFASRGNMIKGLTAGGLGVLFSLIGFSQVSASLRFTMGSDYLWDGIPMVPFLVGLFAFSELIRYMIRGGAVVTVTKIETRGGAWEGFVEVFRHKLLVGATVANFLAYTMAVQTCKNPETFGKGDPRGIIAAEAANDAKDGGALLPTVGFGIPGSAEMVVLLGAFILHGLVPGPLLMRDHLDLVMALILGLTLSNIFASTFGLIGANVLAKLTFIRVTYIIPFLMALCFLAVFAIKQEPMDLAQLVVWGFFGYAMSFFGYPKVCLVIGYVLGVIAEQNFHLSIMIGYGSPNIFFTRPISLV
ncbi:MAG: tripartite tricarboxylate transporter permease [Planctomycetota bacterium]|jgi:putative tricarboxylic transport membrane protein